MPRDGRTDRTLESPLSATWRPAVREPAILVGIDPRGEESALDELEALADSAGAEVVGRMVQRRDKPDATTFVGRGKLSDLHDVVHAQDAGLVVFDDELTPAQLRNVEERLKVKVIDRTALILDIFALHARSREGKAQVELAQLNYLVPRLRGWGEAMSRQAGGIGTRFGGGETKLEIDRQHIRRRIAKLRRDLTQLAKTRGVKRAERERSGIPQIALAGYTNAGKSTLMNALTDADVVVADQLFATLDPTVRRVKLPGGRAVTLSDTVGFVRKLPHQLVEAFRSTLEEVGEATILLHVVDAGQDPVKQIDAVNTVLSELGVVGKPVVLAMNKVDVLDQEARAHLERRYPDAVLCSAADGTGLDLLLDRLDRELSKLKVEVELDIPFDRGEIVAQAYARGDVIEESHTERGTHMIVRIPSEWMPDFGPFMSTPRPDVEPVDGA